MTHLQLLTYWTIKLQERALTIIYNDYDLSFSELLEMPINPQFTERK